MRSEEKFALKTKPMYGKEWIVIEFPNGTTWIPSFEDMVRIWRAIGELEDIAYPPPARGRWYMVDLLRDAFQDMGKSWEELSKDFKVPIRK